MNGGATAERVYHALKRQILNRAFQPGDRLEPAMLAEQLSSSVTPIRDALHLLAGEGLVRTRTGDGFHLPALHEPGLNDLYAWTCEVLLVAIRGWPAEARKCATTPHLADQLADQASELFTNIAARSDNSEHLPAISSLNARLHPVRLVEPQVLADVPSEMAAIESSLNAADRRTLARLITAYYRRRRRHAAELVRAVYRAAPGS
jgi:DNA-binding GntR family transcriptional regulator